jgi:hypothetical protein
LFETAKLGCNINIVYRNFKSENSQDCAQKPQPNFTFTNSASILVCTSFFLRPNSWRKSVNEKGGKPDRKPYPLPYGLRNPYRNLKSENSEDYAQFMNLASILVCILFFPAFVPRK